MKTKCSQCPRKGDRHEVVVGQMIIRVYHLCPRCRGYLTHDIRKLCKTFDQFKYEGG